MAVKLIALNKLLQLIYLPEKDQTAALRRDITEDIRRQTRAEPGGGHFHMPFWSDAKNFVRNGTDLIAKTDARISDNKNRRRLYPLLAHGFMNWWNQSRRWQNEEFKSLDEVVKTRYAVGELGASIKIENTLALTLSGGSERIIYPYFAEEPPLRNEAIRVGVWLLGQALPAHSVNDIRIIDLLRGNSYGSVDFPLEGDEGSIFLFKYRALIEKWERLRKEY